MTFSLQQLAKFVVYNEKYTKSPAFLKKLGDNWEQIIFEGEKEYEDSKCL